MTRIEELRSKRLEALEELKKFKPGTMDYSSSAVKLWDVDTEIEAENRKERNEIA
jgi:hypothetical protein